MNLSDVSSAIDEFQTESEQNDSAENRKDFLCRYSCSSQLVWARVFWVFDCWFFLENVSLLHIKKNALEG